MKLLLDIPNGRSAEELLNWINGHGYVLLTYANTFDVNHSFIYITDVEEVTDVIENRDSSTDRSSARQVGYSKPGPY